MTWRGPLAAIVHGQTRQRITDDITSDLQGTSKMPFGFLKKVASKIGGAIKKTAKFTLGTTAKVAQIAGGIVLGEKVTGGPAVRITADTGLGSGIIKRTDGSLLGGDNKKLLLYGGLAAAALLLLAKR